jgi:hypothetical protein
MAPDDFKSGFVNTLQQNLKSSMKNVGGDSFSVQKRAPDDFCIHKLRPIAKLQKEIKSNERGDSFLVLFVRPTKSYFLSIG